MRMYFGSIAIVATEVRASVWALKAYVVDNVENPGEAFDVQPVTVTTSEFFPAAYVMAQAAAAKQRIQKR
ncbi:hypothetical protein, partial [Klebsiella aerogenes]|jgi:hypothetical protein|uniref:hypothetical protein n=3 Tax=Pseudomonadota TaxID=1224 RepID=UPI000A6A9665